MSAKSNYNIDEPFLWWLARTKLCGDNNKNLLFVEAPHAVQPQEKAFDEQDAGNY